MSDATRPCSHCGLPAPAGQAGPDEPVFCCAGCDAVFHAIWGEGLGDFYSLRGEETAGEPARATADDFDALDDPKFLELHSRELPTGERSVELHLEGLHCSACVWLIEKLAVRTEGVREVRVDIGRSRARVVWRPESIPLSEVARGLSRVGYRPRPFRRSLAEEAARKEERNLLIKIAVCGAVAGNVMLIAFALYGGSFHGMEAEYESLFRWSSLLVTLPAFLWGGSEFFRGALAGLRMRTFHMDLPISIGIFAGFTGGAVNTVLQRGEIYFDSVSALIFLLLVGRWLQRRQQRRAADATELLASLHPHTARLVESAEAADGHREERTRTVPVEALAPGAVVEVHAGEVLPADGQLIQGRGSLDLSLLTGESRPEEARPGAAVCAGTVLLAGRIRLSVEQVGEASRLGRLLALVEEHSGQQTRIMGAVDRIAGHFVVGVLALAALTAIVWWQLDPEHALDHVMAMLVVTCPCALGLATPLAIGAALGKAARGGILIKGGDALEILSRRGDRHAPAGVLWLDKTGTVTEGRMRVAEWVAEGDADIERARGIAAALEGHSPHPVAVALTSEVDRPGRAHDVQEVPGAGVRGRVDGVEAMVGSPAFVTERCGALPRWAELAVRAQTGAGRTTVLVAVEGQVLAAAALADRVLPEAREVVAALLGAGWQVGILSGDAPEVVAVVAAELGVPAERALGGVTPEHKLRTVDEHVSRAGAPPLVMVGDGINDAAALARADVGIAVRGGAEAAMAASDVYLGHGDLRSLAHLFEGSRRTTRVIRRNLLFSLCYNTVGAGLALSGLIGPLGAAILMPVSSLTVITSSFRSTTFPPAAGSRSAEPRAAPEPELATTP